MAGDEVVVGSVAVAVTASARRFARSLRREVQQAFRGSGNELRRSIANAVGGDPISVAIAPEVDKDAIARISGDPVKLPTEPEIDRGALDQISEDNKIDLSVEPDEDDAVLAGRRASNIANRAAGPVNIKADVDRASLRRVISTITKAGLVAGQAIGVGILGTAISAALAGLTSAAAGLVPVIGQLAGVLFSAVGAAAALPGALAIAGAGIGALIVGSSGLGAAFKEVAAGGEAASAAMADLAPAAQQLVRTITGFGDTWRELRLDVQQALFKGISAEIQTLAERQLPVLHVGLVGVAEVLNGAMREGLQALATDNAQIRIGETFESARVAIGNVAGAVGEVVQALLDVSAVGAGVVADLSTGLGESLSGLADRISQAAESGRLKEIILEGLDALKLLGRALGDIFGIVRGLFAAAGEAEGGGIFGFLERLNELVNSIAGQEALTGLFVELSRIGDALMPVLLALVQALGPVVAAIGDIAVAAAPALATLATALGGALASLAPGFTALVPVVEALGTGLQPVADILVGLVSGLAPGVADLVDALAEGLAALAPAAGPVGEALGAVLSALAPLLPLLGQLLGTLLPPLAEVLSTLATALAPVIELIAEFGGKILQRLEPLLAQQADLLGEVAQIIADSLLEILPILMDLWFSIADAVQPLIPIILDLVRALLPLLPPIIELAAALLRPLIDLLVILLKPILALLGPILKLVTFLVDLAVRFAIAPLIGLVANALTFLLSPLTSAAEWLEQVGAVLSNIDWGAVGRAIGDAFATAWRAVANFFVGIYRWLRDLPGRILGALGNLALTLLAKGRELISNLRRGMIDRFVTLYNWARGIPDKIKKALGNAKDLLLNAGRKIIQGLIDGIKDRLGALGDTMSGAAQTIRDRLPFSPAKTGPLAGRGSPYHSGQAISRLLAEGVRSQLPVVATVAESLADQFSARHDSLGGLDVGPGSAMAPMPTALTPGSGGLGGDVHVNLTALSDQFSLRQVMDDLAFRGAV